jgi:hypothetical protein
LKHSDQSTENGVDGDVSGTSIQAGSIEINLGAPQKLRWRKVLWYLIGPATVAVVASSTLALKLVAPDAPADRTPVAVTTATTAESTATPPPASPRPAPPTAAAAPRPAPSGTTPRPGSRIPVTAAPTTTTTAATVVAAPPPAATGVRFSDTLRFGSFNLDLAQPRDMPGTNIWPLTPGRLHGDDGYWLAEWLGDGVPGQPECAADLAKRATRDAEHLIAGSRVCGRTPGGRIFLVDVVALDSTTITGQVTVWD